MATPPDPSARRLALAAEIERDLTDVARIRDEADRALREIGSGPPSALQTYGAGKVAHDFYLALEIIFERVGREYDGGLPSGPAWHRDLLRLMATPVVGLRPAVIPGEVEGALSELLRFRHRFRNLYALDLEWPLIAKHLQGALHLAPRVAAGIQAFVQFLRM